MRACKSCGVRKADSDYYSRPSPDGTVTYRAARCKPCVRAATVAKRGGVPQKQTVYSPFERYRANQRTRFNRFGITACAYALMRIEQNDQCAICAEPFSAVGKTPPIDHCHESGRVRGLLCTPCNVALGHMRDNPALLRAAAEYLETR